jgi:ribose transport system ATP-binding protein
MPEPILQLEAITKKFPGVVALDHVSLEVFPGEIHAIIGENGAGKSTLMNILAGELQPDEGLIRYHGNEITIPSPLVSRALGISVVFQELALCPNLSIAENISLWRASEKFPFSLLNRRMFYEKGGQVLTQLGLGDIDLRTPVGQLSVAKQQLVEIAKAISTNASLLILDEPNSALTQEESEHLFSIVRQLRDAGVAVLYISHHLEEVLQLADRISVLRDGRLVDSLPASQATIGGLITRMVGRTITAKPRQFSDQSAGAPTLQLSHLSSRGGYQDISFELHRGEFLGIAGLPDSFKDELVEGLFGLRPSSQGEIRVDGQPVAIRSPLDAIHHGMYLIPADRRGAGALLQMSLRDNIVVSSLKDHHRAGFLRTAGMRRTARRHFQDLDIRASSLEQLMANLSGGNQQKVILARGLATQASILVLHEPTRGIDVGAKAEIYRILQELAGRGAAILIVSSELPELISQCDRILVMYAGRICGEFDHQEATEEAILACAMGQATHLKEPVERSIHG